MNNNATFMDTQQQHPPPPPPLRPCPRILFFFLFHKHLLRFCVCVCLFILCWVKGSRGKRFSEITDTCYTHTHRWRGEMKSVCKRLWKSAFVSTNESMYAMGKAVCLVECPSPTWDRKEEMNMSPDECEPWGTELTEGNVN